MSRVTEKSIEQLMAIAKNPIKEDEFKTLPPAKRFINSAGIKDGKDKIPAALIYDRYLQWADTYKVEAASQRGFFLELKLYFNKVKYGTGFAYIMSCDGFNMSPEYLALVNGAKRNSYAKKKVKKEHSD